MKRQLHFAVAGWSRGNVLDMYSGGARFDVGRDNSYLDRSLS
jgi:hypothetical protein